jgi:hypothetical protein
MGVRKRLRALLMAVLLATGAAATLSTATLLSTTTPAFAGSGGGPKGHPAPRDCWDEQVGNSCYGLNPQTTGCAASAYTVYNTLYGIYHFSDLFGYVELRYSTGCGSNWSRVTSQVGGETISATISNNLSQSLGNAYSDSNGAYSFMIGGAHESDRACGVIDTTNGIGTGCSQWG